MLTWNEKSGGVLIISSNIIANLHKLAAMPTAAADQTAKAAKVNMLQLRSFSISCYMQHTSVDT